MATRMANGFINQLPEEGMVAHEGYRYYQNGMNRPTPGSIYSGGKWLSPAQYKVQQSQLNYIKTADTAANKLNTLLQNPSSVKSTPGYQFAYNQGLEAVNRTAAAKGQLGSGNRLYDLTKFGQGLASQTYNNTVSQLTNLLNRDANALTDSNYGGGNNTLSLGSSVGKLYYGGMGG